MRRLVTRFPTLARRPGRCALALLGLLACLLPGAASRAFAQQGSPIRIPVFVDPERRIERRAGPRIATIRFLTEDDYPPFNFVAADGQLQGFNIDLARAICAEIEAQCTIQPRRWDLLLPALDTNEGDAVIASHRIDGDLRRRFEVSQPVYRVPARFAGHKDGAIQSTDAQALQGKSIAVVGGSRHEAYLNALFPAVRIERFPSFALALEAMRRRQVDLAFGDGVAIAFWLNGSESLDCCTFIGGAYAESRYFGEGAGIVMRKGNVALRQAIDDALTRMSRDGRFARLYLKHFPVPFY
ncbi:MAG: transporter substrate-binding domain-containing protein [Methylobacterium sp.]|nr:transporter substrate-binding domain-containing protein [Methylobacterium sp.]